MTRRRKPNEQAPNGPSQTYSLPAQEDEADILDEVGGNRDEGGELLVDEETVEKIGAVDAASVRENRRMDRVVNKKRGGEKNVVFNTDDLLTKYEELIKRWPPNTLDISVKRLTGTAVTHTILSRPRSGAELYQAIKDVHGPYEEAQYEVKFLDTTQRQYRGTGRITMPDTRPAGQQGQPMHYPPNGAPPPGYPQQPWQSPQPQPTPPAQFVPQATDPMAMMGQMFQLLQQMQAAVPQPQVQFQPPPAMSSPQVTPTDPMAMMTQMFEMLRKMQGQVVPPAVPQPQFQPAPTAAAPQQPVVDPMVMMTTMFDLFQKMQSSMRSAAEPGPSSFRRPPYSPQGDRGEGGPSRYQGPPGPPQLPQRQLTMAEQFRESISVVRQAASVIQEMETMLPGREQDMPGVQADDDDSPVRVIDTGPAKIVVNKSDGSTRLWETGMANMDKIFKWVGEQHEVIQKAHAAKQQPQRQLPPGYVEVGPGYTPPPGFVAVPEDPLQHEQESPLSPAPENIPPPIGSSSSRTWGAPTIPSEDQNEN